MKHLITIITVTLLGLLCLNVALAAPNAVLVALHQHLVVHHAGTVMHWCWWPPCH